MYILLDNHNVNIIRYPYYKLQITYFLLYGEGVARALRRRCDYI
jgi:hypothetical protein